MSELWGLLWKWRQRLAIVWVLVAVLALLRLVMMENVYTSSCLLTPLTLEQVEGQSPGGLGIASARSLLTRGGDRSDYTVVAFLESRQLVDAVVAKLGLARELFPRRWDEKTSTWNERSGGEPLPAESRQRMDEHLDVSYDELTGLVRLDVHWRTPEGAREIADAFVSEADSMLRASALADGERRADELLRQMETVAVSEVRVYLAEEMTRAISSLASIRARSLYAFRVVDPPVVPFRKSWPPRLAILLLVAVGTAVVELGVVAGFCLRRSDAAGPGRAFDRPGAG